LIDFDITFEDIDPIFEINPKKKDDHNKITNEYFYKFIPDYLNVDRNLKKINKE